MQNPKDLKQVVDMQKQDLVQVVDMQDLYKLQDYQQVEDIQERH